MSITALSFVRKFPAGNFLILKLNFILLLDNFITIFYVLFWGKPENKIFPTTKLFVKQHKHIKICEEWKKNTQIFSLLAHFFAK
jgi:hypothetical protein